MLVDPRDQAIAHPHPKPHPDIQALAGFSVLMIAENGRANNIAFMHEVLDNEGIDQKRIDDELEPGRNIGLALGARCPGNLQRIHIDRVHDVVGEKRRDRLEVPVTPMTYG